MKFSFANVRKFIAALVGVAAEAADAGLVHGTAAHIIAVAVAVATAVGVFVVPNSAKPATPPNTPATPAAPATTA